MHVKGYTGKLTPCDRTALEGGVVHAIHVTCVPESG